MDTEVESVMLPNEEEAQLVALAFDSMLKRKFGLIRGPQLSICCVFMYTLPLQKLI